MKIYGRGWVGGRLVLGLRDELDKEKSQRPGNDTPLLGSSLGEPEAASLVKIYGGVGLITGLHVVLRLLPCLCKGHAGR